MLKELSCTVSHLGPQMKFDPVVIPELIYGTNLLSSWETVASLV